MSTWLDQGASGGLAGARRQTKDQPIANSPNRLTHRNPDGPDAEDLKLSAANLLGPVLAVLYNCTPGQPPKFAP